MEIGLHSFLFHLGDYYAHTSHLSDIEDLAYRRLIDHYYLHQHPPVGRPDQIARMIRLRDHVEAVQQVLHEFFVEESGGDDDNPTQVWRHKRCDEEIARYLSISEGGRKGAAIRWAKHRDAEAIAPLSPPQSTPNANHKPLTINQEPIEKKKRTSAPVLECPPEVTEQTWTDFVQMRKRKRADITQTALDVLSREARKAGLSLEAVLRECVTRGWVGFKSEWAQKSKADQKRDTLDFLYQRNSGESDDRVPLLPADNVPF